MSVKELFTKTEFRGILATIIIVGGGYILCINSVHNDIKFGIFGLMNLVGGFYFGSSSSSERKNETIKSMVEKSNQ